MFVHHRHCFNVLCGGLRATSSTPCGVAAQDWIQIDSDPALWLEYHKVYNKDDKASVEPWTPDWSAPVSTRERTMRYRTHLAAPEWLKKCLLGE